MFSQIGTDRRGRPPTCHEVAMSRIGAPRTRTGPGIRAELGPGAPSPGVTVPGHVMKRPPLDTHEWHGTWHHTPFVPNHWPPNRPFDQRSSTASPAATRPRPRGATTATAADRLAAVAGRTRPPDEPTGSSGWFFGRPLLPVTFSTPSQWPGTHPYLQKCPGSPHVPRAGPPEFPKIFRRLRSVGSWAVPAPSAPERSARRNPSDH
ncbi:hypothetical protein KNE206_68270 [Kitasatospora sp. NE20-6]